MKKSLIVVLLVAFMVPSIAFASWWNPLSWFNNWTFKKSEPQVQMLENRILELENKLNNTSQAQIDTNTPESSESKEDVEKVTEDNTSTQEISKNNTGEYKEILTSLMNNEIKLLQSQVSNADKYILEMNNRITFLNTALSNQKNHLNSGDDLLDKISNALVEYYQGDIDLIKLRRDSIITRKNDFVDFISHANNDMQNSFDSVSSHADFLKWINELNSLNLARTQKSEFIGKQVSDYLESAKSSNDLYIQVTQAQLDRVNQLLGLIEESSNSYQAPPELAVPNITIPKITNCSYRENANGGNYMSCVSY